jgi:predicted amidohydrolase
LEGYEGYDWGRLRKATRAVVDAGAGAGIWVIFGSVHPLSDERKPHNSLYIVNDRGELVDRYDKLFCAGDASETAGELAHYTPGSHFCVFEVKGVRLGTLICHEYRYPELYREYGRRGVSVMLHSFHAGNLSAGRFAEMEEMVGAANHALNPATTIAGITQPTAMHGAASSNNMWISCSNSSSPRSCWPAFVVRPDGVVTGKLEPERPGILVTEIDLEQAFYDSTKAWRDRASRGVYHSGTLIDDPRSNARQEF